MNWRFMLGTIWVTLVTAMMLTACERHGAVGDLQDYLVKVKEAEKNKKRVSIIAELKPPKGSAYEAIDARSPFHTREVEKNQAVASNPLLAYPLSVLRFVGTLTQGDVTFAFIMTPDSMVYQVKAGDVIGDHQGKVVEVTSNRVNVMEQETEKGQAVMQRIVTLELKEGF